MYIKLLDYVFSQRRCIPEYACPTPKPSRTQGQSQASETTRSQDEELDLSADRDVHLSGHHISLRIAITHTINATRSLHNAR